MVHRLLTPRAWKRSPSSILDTKDSWSNRPTERGVLKVWRCRLELAPPKRCSIRSEHEWELQIFSSKLASRFKHPQPSRMPSGNHFNSVPDSGLPSQTPVGCKSLLVQRRTLDPFSIWWPTLARGKAKCCQSFSTLLKEGKHVQTNLCSVTRLDAKNRTCPTLQAA